jgi:hypothetical protein
MKKVKLSIILLLSIVLTGLQAQETIPASGGNATGSGGSASYSIGQVIYTTNTATNGSAMQGVQHPYEISIVAGVETAKTINLTVLAYPNPVVESLTLIVEDSNFKISTLSFQLYNINGKIVEDRKITYNKTTISMGKLVPATYFLKVTDSNIVVKTFKIIKN